MKVRELLKSFSGDNKVIIYDSHDYSTHEHRNFEQAILNHGHFTVKRWFIENDVITICIQSQF